MALENDWSGLLEDDGEYICDNKTNENVETFNRNYETSPMVTEQEPVNKWALRDRLHSKVLWAGVISEVIRIVQIIYQWVKYGIEPSSIEILVMSVLTIMSLFGIFNDPTNKEGF